MSWFGSLVVEPGSSRGYFGKVELGFGTLGEEFGNLSEHWHSWGRRSGSDEVEFGKLEGEFGKWEEGYFDNWGDDYFGNQLMYNKPGMNSVKVENDLGMIRISLGSSSPRKR